MHPLRRIQFSALAGLLGGLVLCVGPAAAAEPERSLLLATTTSVQDSGLLDALLPVFTQETGIKVRSVAVGTGAALRMGREGDVDVLLTHAPESEKALLEEGSIDRRVEIMENFFVLVGPKDDPAGIRSAASIADALRTLDAKRAPFVSRADDSGTHKREVALLTAAGLDPKGGRPGWTRTGSGMGLSLQIASEKQAYILSDIGTFLAFEARTGLDVVSGPEAALRNVYAVLRVSPERFPKVHRAEADAFIDWFARPDVAARVADFGVARFGRALFVPIRRDGAPTAP